MPKYLVAEYGNKWDKKDSKKICDSLECSSYGILDEFPSKGKAIEMIKNLLIERMSIVGQNDWCDMCFEDLCESVDCEETFKEFKKDTSKTCEYAKKLHYKSGEKGFDIWCEAYTSHIKKLSEIERYSIKEIEDCSGKLIREFEVNLYDDEEWNFNK